MTTNIRNYILNDIFEAANWTPVERTLFETIISKLPAAGDTITTTEHVHAKLVSPDELTDPAVSVDNSGRTSFIDAIFLPDNKQIRLGGAIAAFDMSIMSDGTRIIINDENADTDIRFQGTADNVLVIDAGSNRVGIGFAGVPDAVLHVNSGIANNIAKFESTDVTAHIEVADDTGSASFGSIAGQMRLFVLGQAVEAVRILTDGKVGINETVPTVQLQVNSGTDDTVALFESTDANANILCKGIGTTIGVGIQATNNDLQFLVAAGSTPEMTLNANGQLGIGLTTVGSILDIEESMPAAFTLLRHSNSAVGNINNKVLHQYRVKDDGGTYRACFDINTSLSDIAAGTHSSLVRFNGSLNAASVEFLRFQDASMIINNGQVNLDFSVNSDVTTDALFVQGSDGFVGVNTGTPSELLTVTEDTAGQEVLINYTVVDANPAVLTFEKDRGGIGVAGDDIGKINFKSFDDGVPTIETYASIYAEINDPSAGFEYGDLFISTIDNGTLESRIRYTAGQLDFLSSEGQYYLFPPDRGANQFNVETTNTGDNTIYNTGGDLTLDMLTAGKMIKFADDAFLGDDIKVNFGNTTAAPDAWIEWISATSILDIYSTSEIRIYSHDSNMLLETNNGNIDITADGTFDIASATTSTITTTDGPIDLVAGGGVAGDVYLSSASNIVRMDATNGLYFGADNANDTWKIERVGDDLAFYRREAGVYVEKGKFTAV